MQLKKPVRDCLRRGQPSLPMLGQLAADMGLHVVGAKVSASNCTRLNATIPDELGWELCFSS